jgi:hypothetical protein
MRLIVSWRCKHESAKAHLPWPVFSSFGLCYFPKYPGYFSFRAGFWLSRDPLARSVPVQLLV